MQESLVFKIAVTLFIVPLTAFFSWVRPVFERVWQKDFSNQSKKQKYYTDKIKKLAGSMSHVDQTIFLYKITFTLLLVFIFPIFYIPKLLWGAFSHEWLIYLGCMVPILSVVFHIFPAALGKALPLGFSAYLSTYYVYSFFARILVFVPIVPFLNIIEKWIEHLLGYDEKFGFLSDEEKEKIRDNSSTSAGKLEKDEKEMIHSIFELKETLVKEIMVPRIDISAIEFSSSFQDVLGAINEAPHSRNPVFRGTIDNIEGIVYSKDMLRFLHTHRVEEWDLKKMLRKPYFVSETKKVNDLLRELKRTKRSIAIVIDEYGGTTGLVTLEDVLEEIVGDIYDEHDIVEVLVKTIDERTYDVDPKINIEELEDYLSVSLLEPGHKKDYDTLGGLIFKLAKAIPQVGQDFEYGHIRIKVLAMDGQRIELVRIYRLEEPPISAEES